MITCTLSRPGLPCNCSMQLIKFSKILNVLYALLVWGSCLSSEQINRINTLFKRSYRCGSAKQINDIVTLVDNASKDLFGKTMAPHHCLHSILPLYRLRKSMTFAHAGTIFLSPSSNIMCIGILFSQISF